MITIYGPGGAPAQVEPEAVPVWTARGWTLTEPSAPAPTDLDLSTELRAAVVSAQPSDVTAPGESEIEGVAPKAPHVSQDEE